MAGIKVPQHGIFKISTDELKHYKWNMTLSYKQALLQEEVVLLFEGQAFRSIARILNKPSTKVNYYEYVLALVVNKKSDFKRAEKGFFLNGKKFKRFVGTNGGLKGDTVLFISEDIHDILYKVSECNRNQDIPFIPAKLEAYRALFFSASQEIVSPKGILVVKDCTTKFKDTVITLKEVEGVGEPVREVGEQELENNVSDGFSICSIGFMEKIQEKLSLDYIPSGVCLRNAWFKGMLYPFPISEFIEKYGNENYEVEDIWGNKIDIRNVELITTESSLKLWKAYKSIDDYIDSYKSNGFEFSVTKIAPKILENQREVNYQYLQSYDFTDEDVKEISDPTINYLKKCMCGDYTQTVKFLGIDGDLKDNSWQQALATNEYMLNDPYVIDSVHKMIKKKINNAKIGKLKLHGNYQIISGDPFSLMQSICGLEVTGILKRGEVYSKYWNELNVKEICLFRSPMTSHNNIRKCTLNNSEEAKYWYRFMNVIMIINGWDSFCIAENGADFDGDLAYSTENQTILHKHRVLPAIQCVQKNAEKIFVTEESVFKSNLNGMGNKVGSITNKVTNMKEVQSHFEKGSKEYEIMEYRMECGQLYQQNEIDKIKGIIFNPMPATWYDIMKCTDSEFDKSLCANKKPYFFIYVYPSLKKEYENYLRDIENNCIKNFGVSLNELLQKDFKTPEEVKFIYWYNKKMPLGFGKCAMNNICTYVESQFKNYKSELKAKSSFDYNILKTNRRCSEAHREELYNLSQLYIQRLRKFKNKQNLDDGLDTTEDYKINREAFRAEFKKEAINICPNDDERLNIILDMCYGCKNNRQFCWDVIGDLIIKRLQEIKEGSNDKFNNE